MAKKSKEPFLPVNRSFFESDTWLSKPFTPGQAWIDLNYLAAYEDTRVIDGNRVYELKPGQLRTSLSRLASRWKWSKAHVRAQLTTWKQHTLIHTEGNTQGYTLTIENYGFVGLQPHANIHTDIHTDTHAESTQGYTQDHISSISKRIENKENKNTDNRVIKEFTDPKTGEERVIIRP